MNDPDVPMSRLASALKERAYRFTTVTPATHARVLARPGELWARGLEDVFGWSRPFHDGVLPVDVFAAMHEAGVLVPESGGWRCSVRFSTLDDDLYIHSAYPTTAADSVFFGPDTYRFAAAIARHLDARQTPVSRAVDIGSGAGPGAVFIAKRAPAAEVHCVDINPAALRMAAVNAHLAGTGNVRFAVSNLLARLEGTFDLIVANPPYLLDKGERAYRHGGGNLGEGLSLAIADLASERLSPGGTMLLYTGTAVVKGLDGLATALKGRLGRDGIDWSYEEIDPDVFGEELLEPAYAAADRIAAVLLTVTRHR